MLGLFYRSFKGMDQRRSVQSKGQSVAYALLVLFVRKGLLNTYYIRYDTAGFGECMICCLFW